MRTRLACLAKQWLPPAIADFLRSRRTSYGYLGDYGSWEAAQAESSGYDDPQILEKVAAATRRAREGSGTAERDGVTVGAPTIPWPLIAQIAKAGLRGRPVTVVDFGGALGTSCHTCRPFLSELPDLRWHVVEQDAFVQCGNREFAGAGLRFFTDPARAVGPGVNLLLLSSVLQYLPAPLPFLEGLLELPFSSVVVDRTPFSASGQSRLTVQRAHPDVYQGSYPAWLLSFGEVCRMLESAFETVIPFDCPETAWGAVYRGIVAESRSGTTGRAGGQ